MTAGGRLAPPDGVTVYLVRHGQTMLNSLGRIQGWCDSPLTPRGRSQAEAVGLALRSMGVDVRAAWTADMVRHHETATLALATGGFDVVPRRDARLREAAFGPLEGSVNEDLWALFARHSGFSDSRAMLDEVDLGRYLEIFDQLRDMVGETDLVVETTAQVAARAVEALGEIAAVQHAAGGGAVLVVSSGLTIISVLRHLGFSLDALDGELGNGALSMVHHDGANWRVLAVNHRDEPAGQGEPVADPAR